MSEVILIRPDGWIDLITTEEDQKTGELVDIRQSFRPGQSIGQHTYKQLRIHGSGKIDIDFSYREPRA